MQIWIFTRGEVDAKASYFDPDKKPLKGESSLYCAANKPLPMAAQIDNKSRP